MAKKREGQFRIHLRPEHGGAYTRWRVTGSTPSAVPARQLDRLMWMMAYWSGWPVELALSVDLETAGWCEWWADVLAGVHPEHLRLRFVARRRRGKGEGGG